MTDGSTTYFPRQKLASSQKTKKWGERCIKSGVNEAMGHDGQGIRKSMYDKQINYDLTNGILHQSDLETIVSEYGAKGKFKSHQIEHKPIMNPKINVLVGEEINRGFDFYALLTNPEANTRKRDQLKEKAKKMIVRGIKEGMSRAEAQKRLTEFKKQQKYTFQDKREQMANSLSKYYYQKLDMKRVFNAGWRDALIAGEEVYCVNVVGSEVSFRRVDPLTLHVARLGTRPFIDDADIIAEDTYESIGWVLDHYYDVLKEKDITAIEKQYRLQFQDRMDLLSNKTYDGVNPVSELMAFDYGVFSGGAKESDAYDVDGNIRVTRVVWRSMRKIGVLTYYDDQGNKQKDLVHEKYDPDEEEGEEINWYWVNEWWEGTRLGEDIYVKIQPRPVQFKDRSNLSAGGSGYIGTVYNINSSKAMSVVDLLKPYQYMYNELNARVKLAMKKWQGPMVELDLAKKPNWMDMTDLLQFAQESGFLVIDSNREDAQGRVAQNTTGKQLNPTMGSYIQDHWTMMQEIKGEMEEVVGISRQRQGQTQPREAVSNVEQSIARSVTITEPLMFLHEKTKERVMQAVVETGKYAMREDEFRQEYVLDDGSREVLNFSGKELSDEDIGIFISSSMDSRAAIQTLRQGAMELMKAGTMRVSDFIKLSASKSSSEIMRGLEESENEAIERQEMARREELKSKEQQAQMQQETEMRKEQMKNKLEVAKLRADKQESVLRMRTEDKEVEYDYNIDKDEVDVSQQEAEEMERHNKAMEEISKREQKENNKNSKDNKNSKANKNNNNKG